MTANEARHLILSARCAVVYFTKRDGTRRRMVCHVPDLNDVRAFTRKAELLTVWDVEKGGVRTVNLATVEAVKPVNTRTPEAAADRAPAGLVSRMLPGRSMASIAALFDNRA